MKKHNWKPSWKIQKEIKEHYRELFDSAVEELQFERKRSEHLLGELREIEAFTNDHCAKKVAEMARDRYHLNGIIHARLILGED